MTGEFGEFENGERATPNPDESIVEFYVRQRGNEITDKTARQFRTAFGALNDYLDEREMELTQMEKGDVLDWCNWLVTDRGLKESSADMYFKYATRVVTKLKKDNYIRGQQSPFEDVKRTSPFDYKSGAVWPEIDYNKFIESVNEIASPRAFTAILTMCKTGLRNAEVCNLDERDVHIDHPASEILSDPRREIASKPNTIYVDSSITKGQEHNGEVRKDANKSKSTRTIPVDNEIVNTLAWYVSLRPQRSAPGQPVFTSYTEPTKRIRVWKLTKDVYEFEEKHEISENLSISPHFFRHWYVTQMRNNLSTVNPEKLPGTPKQIVKGLRGDSDGDTIDIYTHDWSKGLETDLSSTEEIVREQIPKFFK